MVAGRPWLVFSLLFSAVFSAVLIAKWIPHAALIPVGTLVFVFLLTLMLVSVLKDGPRARRLAQWLRAHWFHLLAVVASAILVLCESEAPGQTEPIILFGLIALVLWEVAKRLRRLSWKQFLRLVKRTLFRLTLGTLALVGVLLWIDRHAIGLLLTVSVVGAALIKYTPPRLRTLLRAGIAWTLSIVLALLASDSLLGQPTEWSQAFACAAVPLAFALITLLRFHTIDLWLGQSHDQPRRTAIR